MKNTTDGLGNLGHSEKAVSPAAVLPGKRRSLLSKVAEFFVFLFERVMPDPFVFAVILTILTAILAYTLVKTSTLGAIAQAWYNGIITNLIGEQREIDLPGFAAGHDVERFRDKTQQFLRTHQNDPVIHKLRWNEPLSKANLDALEKISTASDPSTLHSN